MYVDQNLTKSEFN